MGNVAPMIGRTRPSAIIGQTDSTTASTMAALPVGAVDGRPRSAVPITRVRLPISLPMFSSPLTPPCMPITTS